VGALHSVTVRVGQYCCPEVPRRTIRISARRLRDVTQSRTCVSGVGQRRCSHYWPVAKRIMAMASEETDKSRRQGFARVFTAGTFGKSNSNGSASVA
jgi:hypothetical protein